MATTPIDRIRGMLSSDAPEKRIAAAIVLGELKAKAPPVVKALVASLDDEGPVQRHALEALTNIGAAAKAVDAILPLTGARDANVRSAATQALISAGDRIVPKVEARLSEASPEERRELDRVLARLGGKQAFSALLAGLGEAGEEEAAAAAVAMRQQAKQADGKQRRSYLIALEKLLAEQQKSKEPNVATVKAGLKMLGYLEDERAVATLLAHATSKKQPATVRQEALIALRFTQGGRKPDTKTINALVAAAADDDRTLAQTALITLAGLELPPSAAGRLDALLEHEDLERVRFVIEMLSHRKTADATALLVGVLENKDLRRAKLAAHALRDRPNAAAALADALARTNDRERGQLIAHVLRPLASELQPAKRNKLVNVAMDRLAKGDKCWDAPFEIAKEAHPKQAAKALRALYDKLKRRKTEQGTFVLRLLCRSDEAKDDDHYQLASRLLAASHKDTSASARRSDEALSLIQRLVASGYDVAAALRKDRSVDLDGLYYVGFHFIEAQHPVGEDLLSQVVEKGGRKKIARMAKNKLQLAGASS